MTHAEILKGFSLKSEASDVFHRVERMTGFVGGAGRKVSNLQRI
jgi:hypothetical protein